MNVCIYRGESGVPRCTNPSHAHNYFVYFILLNIYINKINCISKFNIISMSTPFDQYPFDQTQEPRLYMCRLICLL